GIVVDFFFSSRRRHTRCLSDWSSDVCSSDLEPVQQAPPGFGGRGKSESGLTNADLRAYFHTKTGPAGGRGGPSGFADGGRSHLRSEERRVGKEWRARWLASPIRKNESVA